MSEKLDAVNRSQTPWARRIPIMGGAKCVELVVALNFRFCLQRSLSCLRICLTR